MKLIEAASPELQHVGLDDALRVLVVFAERRDARYERAAARFAARVMLERRLGLAEARYVLALAEALPRSPDAVAPPAAPLLRLTPRPGIARPGATAALIAGPRGGQPRRMQRVLR